MKIILMVHRFPELSETFIVNKFLGLVDRGFDVHIVCREVNDDAWRKYKVLQENPDLRNRVHATHAPPKNVADVLRLVTQLSGCLVRRPRAVWRYTLRAVNAHGLAGLKYLGMDAPLVILQPDIVHFEFGTIAAARSYIGEWIGCRLSVSFRGYDLNFAGLDNPAYYSEVWARVSSVHCLGEDLWQRALSRGCPPSIPHVLIPPAIDDENFPEEEINHPEEDQPPFHLLSVGRLHWKKGYEFGLEAVAILRQRGLDVRYTIVGDGPFGEAVAYCRYQLELEDVVELKGPLSHEDVVKEMLKTQIFLHPAVSEGFGNVVVEAQAVGLPVVCTDADGLRENISPGRTGYVVPSRDPVAMADRVEILIRDRELRVRLGHEGRLHVRDRFSKRGQLDAFASFFQAME